MAARLFIFFEDIFEDIPKLKSYGLIDSVRRKAWRFEVGTLTFVQSCNMLLHRPGGRLRPGSTTQELTKGCCIDEALQGSRAFALGGTSFAFLPLLPFPSSPSAHFPLLSLIFLLP